MSHGPILRVPIVATQVPWYPGTEPGIRACTEYNISLGSYPRTSLARTPSAKPNQTVAVQDGYTTSPREPLRATPNHYESLARLTQTTSGPLGSGLLPSFSPLVICFFL